MRSRPSSVPIGIRRHTAADRGKTNTAGADRRLADRPRAGESRGTARFAKFAPTGRGGCCRPARSTIGTATRRRWARCRSNTRPHCNAAGQNPTRPARNGSIPSACTRETASPTPSRHRGRRPTPGPTIRRAPSRGSRQSAAGVDHAVHGEGASPREWRNSTISRAWPTFCRVNVVLVIVCSPVAKAFSMPWSVCGNESAPVMRL